MRIESIGAGTSTLTVGDNSQPLDDVLDIATATQRLLREVEARLDKRISVEAVAHRIVHGGERFVQPTLLTQAVLADINSLSDLAPLHNPPALAAVQIARSVLSDISHVAVFDTAFHASLPPRAREYALPRAVTQRFGIRRYGFHGTSHAHIMQAVAAAMGAPPQTLRIISCHLGNGASVAAIEYGRSIDTSMGMTPLEGLVMGTRSGDVDPGVLLRLQASGEYSHTELENLLN
jgi:acetate kinase